MGDADVYAGVTAAADDDDDDDVEPDVNDTTVNILM